MPIISGGGGGTPFNGGTITGDLNIAEGANGTPLTITEHTQALGGNDIIDVISAAASYVFAVDSFGNVSVAPDVSGAGHAALYVVNNDTIDSAQFSGTGAGVVSITTGNDVVADGKLQGASLTTNPAAPATASLSSGTGAQLSTARDVHSYTPVTSNSTAGAAATCAVAISKDGTNYVALWTETEPAGIAFDGTIHGINVYVPAGWKLKLTVTNATIGTTTYY